MAKRNYVSPVILLVPGGDPGTGMLPFSQRPDPDNSKTGNAKEFEFDDEENNTDLEL